MSLLNVNDRFLIFVLSYSCRVDTYKYVVMRRTKQVDAEQCSWIVSFCHCVCGVWPRNTSQFS